MSRDLLSLDAPVRRRALRLLAAAQKQGVTLIVTQTFRSLKEQAALYAQGRTKPGKIVTYAPPGYSWHNWRRAFDVAIQVYPGDPNLRDLYDGPWEVVGDLGEAVGLEWGGRWELPDRPHFQYTGGLTLHGMRKKHPVSTN